MEHSPSPGRWRQVELLLDAALDLPPEQRSAFLDSACVGDAALRAEVERLLRACAESEHFLLGSAEALAAPILASLASDLDPDDPAAPGDRIGSYRILEEAGRGGMAVVYLAERDDGQFRKRVALKLVRSGVIPEDELLRRFREERQILAELEHPGIARLLDGGITGQGLPWFAMEYVEGTPIERYCDERGLDIEARLSLFCAVCDAVQYAHRRQIVHRDLKPGNILVTGPDGEEDEARVKLLDFGIAKLLAPGSGAEAGEAAERTRPGLRLLTPEYASPEQLRGEAVTPAADVYSLGVLLYRLLSGRRSSGGLDAIVRKSMDERPEQRYADAGDLAAEVRRHVRGEGVGARRAFFRRGRGVAAAAAVLVVLALASYVVSARSAAPALDPQRVVVAPFENHTGDPALDAVGSMAADWIVQGLSQASLAQVVPLPAALSASRFIAMAPGDVDTAERIRMLAEETGAGIVVSGSYYQQGDSLYLLATVTDVGARSVLHALEPFATPSQQPLPGIEALRQRLTGLLAPRFNPRTQHHAAGGGVAPPSFEAYRAHAEGMERFVSGDWSGSTLRFMEAAAHDSSFTIPLLYAAIAQGNLGNFAAADSILARIRPRLHLLGEFEQLGFAMMDATVRGDPIAYYEAHRRAPELAPGTLAHYGVGLSAARVNRPREAVRVLEALDPERGELRGWFGYWPALAEAHHRLGDHRRELRVARRARELFSDDPRTIQLEVRALVSLGRVREARSLVADHLDRVGQPASLLRQAGIELIAHGSRAEGEVLLRESLDWMITHPEDGAPSRRFVAHGHYLLGEWDEAEGLLRQLAAEHPESLSVQGGLGILAARRGNAPEAVRISHWLAELDRPYLRGSNTYWRARIAALLGEPEAAVRLLRQAWQEGWHVFELLHNEPDFDPIRNHPSFRELARPKG
jgi:tRNA A-37 threonylcarbamoyl transferase component Bud32/Flp pilus assembly protein TadD/TolB-like protein